MSTAKERAAKRLKSLNLPGPPATAPATAPPADPPEAKTARDRAAQRLEKLERQGRLRPLVTNYHAPSGDGGVA